MGYLIRCGSCGQDAPLAGELLSDLSDQLLAFQSDHDHGHDHAEPQFVVDRAPEVVVVGAPSPTLVAA